MKNKLVVVTDLGTFKAYRLEKDPLNSSPRLELLEEVETLHDLKISDQVSDQAGRFPRGGGTPGMAGEHSSGERHNIELEQHRRVVKQLAEKLGALLKNDEFHGCYFAAHKEINRQILDHLPHQLKDKIERNVSSNLTKIDKGDLLSHF